jgi:FkbM family methyltransferase
MKKIAFALVLIAVLIGVALAMAPKRRNLVRMRMQGRIRVAQGCSVFTPGIFEGEERFEETQKKVREMKRDGPLALYETPIGPIWYRVGAWTLPALVEENESDEYAFRTTIKPGDVVLDVGANVGTDTRTALAAGAGLVVAIEPEPVTLECFRRNLANELRENRVILVPKGAWNKEDTLMLHVDAANAGGSSFVWQKSGPSIQVPLTTIDKIASDLKLPKVDLIKMDIEGSEKNALLGAAEVIRRYHPKLALALEHSTNDVQILPAVARQLWSGYHLTLTPCVKTFDLIHPDVALLSP